MRLNTIVLTAAVSVASIIPAFAHHGWGGNVDEVTALTGMVTEGVKLPGPHGLGHHAGAPVPHPIRRPEAGHHSRRGNCDSARSAQSRSKPFGNEDHSSRICR